MSAEVHALAENVRAIMRALVLDGHATPVAERIVGAIVDVHDKGDDQGTDNAHVERESENENGNGETATL